MLAKAAGQMRDEKLHAIVARSTCRCRSQNVQNTPGPECLQKLQNTAVLEAQATAATTTAGTIGARRRAKPYHKYYIYIYGVYIYICVWCVYIYIYIYRERECVCI